MLLALLSPAHSPGSKRLPRGPLAAALAQKKAGKLLRARYDRFATGYGERPALKVLPCERLRTRRRRGTLKYVFHCSVAVLQSCVFVAPDLESAHTCDDPRPYQLADEDKRAERGLPERVVPWWYDELPRQAFVPSVGGYLNPWCTGPAGIEYVVRVRSRGRALRLRAGRPFVFRPDMLRLAPWKCPLGPYELVS